MSFEKEIDFSPYQGKKNLLAFSAGIDSTALFYLLLEHNIDFDFAIVNYNLRSSSRDELHYAHKLADIHQKKLYDLETSLTGSALEASARKIRFDFFESIIQEHGYENLLTGHQLNDQMEWFLMQLTKGAGSLELLGMQTLVQRNNYTLCKPMLKLSKEQLQHYLDTHQKKYFIDETNTDESYKRNYFRHHFSDALVQHYQEGINRSFDYLQKDNERILEGSQILCIEALTLIFAPNERAKLYYIDKDLKKRGYILSQAQRLEIQSYHSVVISGSFVIEKSHEIIYIAPCVEEKMEKKFKEQCRVAQIPSKIRPYLSQVKMDIDLLKKKILEWRS